MAPSAAFPVLLLFGSRPCSNLLSFDFSAFPGWFSFGDWSELSAIPDGPLAELAQQLPRIVMSDRAPSTVQTYTRAFQRWKLWAGSHDLPPLPARAIHLCLYVAFLMQSARTFAPINCSMAAIAWAHEKAGLDNPTQSAVLQQTINGARRLLAAPVKKKKPLTPSNIRQIIEHFIQPSTDLAQLQTVTLIVLGFASFLRWDELHRLAPHSLRFFSTHMAAFIDQRKNDRLREGHWVFIARSGSPSCPVALVERFLREGAHGPDQPLFCKIGRRKSGTAFLRTVAMTYSRARELVGECLRAIGLDSSQYGLHSLRAGGASAAANAGVPDRLFRRHGGWKSEAAKDGYLQESISDLLCVSRSLHL